MKKWGWFPNIPLLKTESMTLTSFFIIGFYDPLLRPH